jgi:hypothetical protein
MSAEERRFTGPHANRNYRAIEPMIEEEEEDEGFSVLHSIVEVHISFHFYTRMQLVTLRAIISFSGL